MLKPVGQLLQDCVDNVIENHAPKVSFGVIFTMTSAGIVILEPILIPKTSLNSSLKDSGCGYSKG